MTPEQALQILDQAAARAPLTRQEHAAVVRAIGVLAQMLQAREQASEASEVNSEDKD